VTSPTVRTTEPFSPPAARGGTDGAFRAVWSERPCGRLPLEAFRVLAARAEQPAFLHSGDGAGPGGRWSLIALDREAVFRLAPDDPADPFDALRVELSRRRWRGAKRPATPFIGGWIGCFSYDLAHRVERLRTSARVDHGFPLIELAFYRRVLSYDHERRTWTASELVEESADTAIVRTRLEALLDNVTEAPLPERDPSPALRGALSSNFSREQYEDAVRRVLDYIAAGDTYQVNVSQRFEGRLAVAPEELAVRVFEASPAPFSAYLRFGDRAVVSSSPERFLRVQGRGVETWPIKGTRPRGATAEEDARLRAELLASEKEQAELVMITDLLRNDLGRVCDYGSVRVPELRAVASYQSVHHTYSRVAGRLREGADLADLLRVTLPGGSVTGAPKVRAMEIIEELEPTARGPYCGAIGWIGVDGAMDLSIAIRTMALEAGRPGRPGKRVTFQVGGGIVADSDPAAEYEETLHKARGILKALGAESAVGVR
jgi:para-aminobenzoate synthetase component 1